MYERGFPWLDDLSGPGFSHYRGFTITLRHTELGRTSLDEWPARCRDLWQHTALLRRELSMLPAGGKKNRDLS